MDVPFLILENLKFANNRTLFAEKFGRYLGSLYKPELQDLLYSVEEGFVDYKYGGEYYLLKNEENRSEYVTDYIEDIIAKDKYNILTLLQECSLNQPNKVERICRHVIDDINYVIRKLDELSWLNCNEIIEKYLTGLIKEIRERYLYSENSIDKSSFKPMVWLGEAIVLAEFFEKLMTGNTSHKGKAFITDDKQMVAEFICSVFAKNNNESFDISTMKRYFREGKDSKRNSLKI